ncbi:trypsin-like serine protease [Actinotalea solisilvae]|uniref:trypsin-like serine protease n=1 Tax=Actinotalea solisilvae TaxID=2072922 RepID=UPI0018F24E61|nr:trypsin-like serine protease [Actinotalea solisilvae]
MRRPLITLVALIALLVGLSAPASAITGNYVEDTEHPYVGLVVFYDADGEFTHRCSGALLTPTVFLTAGHCTAESTEAVTARVYFQQDAGVNYDPATELDPVSGYPETCAAGTLGVTCAMSDQLYDYGFTDFEGFPNARDVRDVGLVVLDQPIMLPEYGVLAAAGTLDGYGTQRGRQDLTVTASGYGLTESNPVHVTSFRERLMASARINNVEGGLAGGFTLQSNGNGTGKGGTCSGDSGGPVFLGGYTSNTIVAVTSYGLNAWCRGNDFAYRTDRAEILAWILATVEESGTAYDDVQVV